MQLNAAVVINEFCYNPDGNDLGFEWIELYNNGSVNEQLQDAKILSGGASFTLQYTLPAFMLRPGRFLLIGGTNVPNSQFTYNFTFQNGGTETDGIHFESADGSYTDTVLYDSPNTNLLPDDSGNPGISFAPTTGAGCSLARITDGFDTNDCAVDFAFEWDETPGTANHARCDYAIGEVQLSYETGIADITVWLKNNSLFSPAVNAIFTITQMQQLYYAEIPPLAPQDSVSVQAIFACTEAPLYLELQLEDDNLVSNNSLVVSPVGGLTTGVMFSEFLADPESGNQEWIELSSFDCIPCKEGVSIMDASGNSTNFTWSGGVGLFVVCRDKAALLARYPDCPATSIIEASSWTYLNNDGDSLVLLSAGVVMDSIAYTGAEIVKGISRERYSPEDSWLLFWRNCTAETGGTPGQDNSKPPPIELPDLGSIRLDGSPCKAIAGESISIAYLLPAMANRISCKVFDLRGSKIRILADNTLCSDRGIFTW
ncbi:MAG: lamin tail domain-containing protein, partial [Candidatus Cloacimonas sp.]|nr:lamin tail domain-containing protein [Candidatus Cloacimonas sp.]